MRNDCCLYLVAPFAVGAVTLAAAWRKTGAPELPPERPDNPLQIGPALQMTALFQLVLFGVAAVGRTLGDRGVLASGALLGLTDVDALTISMTDDSDAPNRSGCRRSGDRGRGDGQPFPEGHSGDGARNRLFRRVTGGVVVAMAGAILAGLLVIL